MGNNFGRKCSELAKSLSPYHCFLKRNRSIYEVLDDIYKFSYFYGTVPIQVDFDQQKLVVVRTKSFLKKRKITDTLMYVAYLAVISVIVIAAYLHKCCGLVSLSYIILFIGLLCCNFVFHLMFIIVNAAAGDWILTQNGIISLRQQTKPLKTNTESECGTKPGMNPIKVLTGFVNVPFMMESGLLYWKYATLAYACGALNYWDVHMELGKILILPFQHFLHIQVPANYIHGAILVGWVVTQYQVFCLSSLACVGTTTILLGTTYLGQVLDNLATRVKTSPSLPCLNGKTVNWYKQMSVIGNYINAMSASAMMAVYPFTWATIVACLYFGLARKTPTFERSIAIFVGTYISVAWTYFLLTFGHYHGTSKVFLRTLRNNSKDKAYGREIMALRPISFKIGSYFILDENLVLNYWNNILNLTATAMITYPPQSVVFF